MKKHLAKIHLSNIIIVSLILNLSSMDLCAQRIAHTNWFDEMQPIEGQPEQICVSAYPDNEITLELRVAMNKEEIPSDPKMYYYFRAPNGDTSYFEVNQSMVSVVKKEALFDYVAHVAVISIPVGGECIDNSSFCLDVDVQLVSLVDGIYMAYPCGLFNGEDDVFPASIFSEATNSEDCSEHITIKKEICCSDLSLDLGVCNSEVVTNGPHNCRLEGLALIKDNPEVRLNDFIPLNGGKSKESISLIEISPVPFRNTVTIEVYHEELSSILIESISNNGNCLKEYENKYLDRTYFEYTLNTERWNKGVNYIRIVTNKESQVIKILKQY